MKQNIGGIDRYIRIGVGAALVIIGTIGVHSLIVSIIGLIVMGTGVFRFCGLYTLLGVDTSCKIKPKEEQK